MTGHSTVVGAMAGVVAATLPTCGAAGDHIAVPQRKAAIPDPIRRYLVSLFIKLFPSPFAGLIGLITGITSYHTNRTPAWRVRGLLVWLVIVAKVREVGVKFGPPN